MDDLIPREATPPWEPRVSSLEAQVAVLREIANDTKQALRDIRTDIKDHRAETRQGFADLRAELKHEISAVRSELKEEAAELRKDLKQEIAELRVDSRRDTIELRTDVKSLRDKQEADYRALMLLGAGAAIAVWASLTAIMAKGFHWF